MEDFGVCAVVVTYNRKKLVEKCIKAIMAQKDAKCDVIVIDNGSTDGTDTLFKEIFNNSHIKYFKMLENLGCAAGTSIGIKEAIIEGYKYIWVMDDDVIPHQDTLIELLNAGEKIDEKWGILSSVAYWTDGSLSKANIQKKGVFTFMKPEDYKKERQKVAMVSLASMFINADVVKEFGLPISEYFIYTEDYEFCTRIKDKYPIYVIPTSKVTHAMKVNSKVNFAKDSAERLYRYNYLYRNDVHCYKKYGIKGIVYLVIKFCYTALQIVLFSPTDKIEKLRVLTKGYIDGIRFNPRIEKV